MVESIAKAAKTESYRLMDIPTDVKNNTLLKAAEIMDEQIFLKLQNRHH